MLDACGEQDSIDHTVFVVNYKESGTIGTFDDCTKDVL